MSQKFGKMQYPSKIIVQNSMNNDGVYLSSSPVIDFPFNMKTMEKRFEAKNMMYLTPLHLYMLKQSLKRKIREITMPGLYYYMNGILNIDKSKVENQQDLIPIKGVLLELQFCVIQESTGGNNFSYYEGVRIFNRANQTFAELTLDELGCFVTLLDGINISQLSVLATQCGLQLLTVPDVIYQALNISKN